MKITKTQLLELINEELQINQNLPVAIVPGALAHVSTNRSLVNEIILRDYVKEILHPGMILNESPLRAALALPTRFWAWVKANPRKARYGLVFIGGGGCIDEWSPWDVDWFEELWGELAVLAGGEYALIAGMKRQGPAGVALSMFGLAVITSWNLKPEMWNNKFAGMLGVRSAHTKRTVGLAMVSLAIPVATSPTARLAWMSLMKNVANVNPARSLGYTIVKYGEMKKVIGDGIDEMRQAFRAPSRGGDTVGDLPLAPAADAVDVTAGTLGPNQLPDDYTGRWAREDPDLAAQLRHHDDDALTQITNTDWMSDADMLDFLFPGGTATGEAGLIREKITDELRARASARAAHNDTLLRPAPEEIDIPELDSTLGELPVTPDDMLDDIIGTGLARWKQEIPEFLSAINKYSSDVYLDLMTQGWRLFLTRLRSGPLSIIKPNRTEIYFSAEKKFKLSLDRVVDSAGERFAVIKVTANTSDTQVGQGAPLVDDFLTDRGAGARYVAQDINDLGMTTENAYMETSLWLNINGSRSLDEIGLSVRSGGEVTTRVLIPPQKVQNATEISIVLPISEGVTHQTDNLFINSEHWYTKFYDNPVNYGLTRAVGAYPVLDKYLTEHGKSLGLIGVEGSDQIEADPVRQAIVLDELESVMADIEAGQTETWTCIPEIVFNFVNEE